jgi:hypothetical protein
LFGSRLDLVAGAGPDRKPTNKTKPLIIT